jgi:XisI protein
MDAPSEWRDLIERLLAEQTKVPVSIGEIALYTVFDRPQDHYLLMAVGWDKHQRVHAPLIHVDVVDGKLWIQHDGTERGIARDLEAGGVPKDRIVLAFQHLSRRRHGDYAAA